MSIFIAPFVGTRSTYSCQSPPPSLPGTVRIGQDGKSSVVRVGVLARAWTSVSAVQVGLSAIVTLVLILIKAQTDSRDKGLPDHSEEERR